MISDGRRGYKSWGCLKRQMDALLCDALKGGISYYHTKYRQAHNVWGRATINCDGKDLAELDVTKAESKATCKEIQEYVPREAGLKAMPLYIAQVKAKFGIIEWACHNHAKSEDAKQPVCPPEKERVITEALRHLGMV